MLPKNEQTHSAKNYRAIFCLNITHELCISCLNSLLEHQCQTNNITIEQALGKNGTWGTLEQLLIDKKILKAKTLKRNTYPIWLENQKAFDSATHDWLLRSLKLAKVPPQLTSAIQSLAKSWNTTITSQISN